MLKNLQRNKTLENIVICLALIFSFLALSLFAVSMFPIDARMEIPGQWVFGVDWKEFIGPDVRTIVMGGNPYIESFDSPTGLYPPWAYLLLSPLTLVTPGIASVLIFTITYFVFAFMLYKFQYPKLVFALFMFSPFLFKCAWSGNIDWLAALGFIMPAPIGLVFAMIKPQVGIGMTIFWLVQAWQNNRLRGVLKLFAPVTTLYLLSFFLYGFWPARMIQMPKHSIVFYPITLVLGIYLLWQALRRKNKSLAIAASPLLSPYANYYTYGLVLFAVDSPISMAILIFLAWLR